MRTMDVPKKWSTPDFTTLLLKVQNKAEKNIELVWTRTFFIDPSGGTNGYFTFGNETFFEEKEVMNAPTFIFPNVTIERKIYPMANRFWNIRMVVGLPKTRQKWYLLNNHG